jgi:hypothetical protein
MAAIEDLEMATGGQPLGTVVNNLHLIGITTLKMALWAGLKHEDASLTPNLVRKHLQKYLDDKKPLKALTEAVNEAVMQSGLFVSEASEVAAAPSASEGNGQPEPGI